MVSAIFQITGYKRVLTLFEKGRTDEAKALLTSLQEEFLAVCEENEVLKTQLSEVAEVLDLAEKVQYDGQKYWLMEEGKRKGPFCQLCYDKDGLLVHLQQHDKHWECQSCRSLYMIPQVATAPKRKKAIRTTLKKTIPLFMGHELG
ncbi:hypothetical protein [Pseudodesulfovibrio tunisiensis]|uniref:hypothetical protein n=1 Tax=Pseudodesulfovibrio tunisiensis TaxID=463192 RepID=UPI001FB427F2|nr:hypothetical protein [Pseudodesulfovibrio tunisiensis]